MRRRDLTPGRVRGLFRLGNQLRHVYRDQLGDEAGPPEFVMLNNRSDQIQQRALELARQASADEEAVRTLTKLAGRHTRDLQVAAHSLRRSNRHREFAVVDRAYRLLQAVITGDAVSRPSVEEQTRLDMLAEFRNKPPREQFRILTDIEPALGPLADELTAIGWTGRAPTSQQLRDPRSSRIAEQWNAANTVLAQLKQIVGPYARTDDPLIRSGTAAHAAFLYLRDTAQPST